MTIYAQNLGLNYPLLEKIPGSYSLSKTILRSVGGVINRNTEKIPEVRALDGLTFKINDGERLGIVGHNGAGKSSLLKTLAGIYPNTSGSLVVNGSISSLLDLNTGFEPDLSGRKNIIQKMKMQGVDKKEIESRVREIEDFCELNEFFDLPIRSYSTGMFVRLSFGLATASTPDILILDEMLSAGDAAFIQKAKKRLDDFLEKSRIIILASHDMSLLARTCNKGLLLKQGQQQYFGDIETAIKMYEV